MCSIIDNRARVSLRCSSRAFDADEISSRRIAVFLNGGGGGSLIDHHEGSD